MSSRSTREEGIAAARRAHLIGRFRISLCQTESHPDQRSLNGSWVDKLCERFTHSLNRPLHPIDVLLVDDRDAALLQKLVGKHTGGVLLLPADIKVLVFSGQHRLATLPKLELPIEELWWDGDIFMNSKWQWLILDLRLTFPTELEVDHPAEFITMMHESNAPEAKLPTVDADLFNAVAKLKAMLGQGKITEQQFVDNRQVLLAHNTDTRRAISMLTRNNELMDAVTHALERPHIRSLFKATPWKALTTGRFYGVGQSFQLLGVG